MLFDLQESVTLPALFQYGNYKKIGDIPGLKLSEGIYQSHFHIEYEFQNSRGDIYESVIDGAGMSFNAATSRFICFMELLERFCGLSDYSIRTKLQKYQPADRVWDLDTLLPFSPAKLSVLEKTLPRACHAQVNGTGLLTGLVYSVPAFAVFPRWKMFVYPENYILPESEGSGSASGFVWEYKDMLRRALCETIERDNIMMSWRTSNWPVAMIENPPLSVQQTQWLEENDCKLDVYNVGEMPGLPVVMALIHKTDGNKLTLGSSCGGTYAENIRKAVMEAIMLQNSARALENDSTITLRDFTSSEDHLMYAWKEGHKVASWYRNNVKSKIDSPTDLAPLPGLWDIAKTCWRVYGGEPVYIDLSDKRVCGGKYCVARVLLPNIMKKEYRHQYMYDGGKRLEKYLAEGGSFNTLPHPIA
jgi:hypothetical protein